MAEVTKARIPLIAGNWKMNLDHLQSIAFVQKLAWSLKDARHDFAAAEVGWAAIRRAAYLPAVFRSNPGQLCGSNSPACSAVNIHKACR